MRWLRAKLVFAWQARTLNDAPSEVVYDFHSEEAGTDPEDAVSFDVGRNSESHGNFVHHSLEYMVGIGKTVAVSWSLYG